jgi:hypothetical protein
MDPPQSWHPPKEERQNFVRMITPHRDAVIFSEPESIPFAHVLEEFLQRKGN